MEAAKGNLADNNNNKTFSTGSTLEQRFVNNEVEPTTESPTAEMEVVPNTESPNTFIARPILDQIFAENEGVPTDESPAAKMEFVTTDESPNHRTSHEEREIRRNARNPSGHMANEGDERKFDSLSPSKINHKHSRGLTYSVDPGNEGDQSSTSVPSEGEALRNAVDVDPISRPHYEPIDMTTVGLQRSKRRKSEKNKCYSTIKYIGFTA